MAPPSVPVRSQLEGRGLPATGLPRTIADAGTVTFPLVPWNPCDAHMAAVVGVPTLHYLPFHCIGIASPLLTLAIALRPSRRP